MVTMNPINWSNITSADQIISAPNIVTGGSFWVAMMFMTWIILLMLFIPWGFEVALVASAFIGFIIGLPLVYLGVVAWQYLMVFLGIIMFMFIYIIWNNKGR
jgi:hypothetical protein